MGHTLVDAIVLRHVDYADSDRIVTVFSRERGRLEGRARGVRKSAKRFAGHLDLFTRGRLSFQEGRGAPRLDGAEVTDAYLGVRADLDRLAWAGALAELALKLYGEAEAHPQAFDALVTALEHLDKAPELRPGLLHLLELRLLEEAGLRPHLDDCVGCGAEVGSGPAFVFHVARGGALCDHCVGADGGVEVEVGTLKLLSRGLRFSPQQAARLHFSPTALRETRALVWAFLRYHVGGGWRARRFLEEMQLGPTAPRAPGSEPSDDGR